MLALDAFEIVFVLVPVLMPPLLMRVEDARWVAVLTLLTLQGSFLLPPVGYALLMTRGTLADDVSMRSIAKSIAPYLVAQWLVLMAVVAFPQLVHFAAPKSDNAAPAMSDDEVSRRMTEMLGPSRDDEAAPREGGPDPSGGDRKLDLK